MIDAKDLRIGNWYRQLALGEYAQVDLFLFHEMCDHELNDDASLNDYMQPIPLTPEILEACGFIEYLQDHSYTYYGNQHDDSDFFLCIDWRRRGEGYVPYIKSIEFEHIGRAIKYLHEFQNLFCALVGEELPIDITKLKTEKTNQP